MADKQAITLEIDLETALKRPASEDRPVLLDFFSPGGDILS